MHAYLVNKEVPLVVGRFDSIQAAENVSAKARFDADVITARDEALAEYTTRELTALYNSIVNDKPVKAFKTKGDAARRLVKALHTIDFRGKVVKSGDTRTKDIPAGKLTGELKPVRKDSRIGKLIAALQKGGTLKELADAIGYPEPTLWRDHAYSLQRKGYGRTQRDGKFYLVLPEGVKEPLFK